MRIRKLYKVQNNNNNMKKSKKLSEIRLYLIFVLSITFIIIQMGLGSVSAAQCNVTDTGGNNIINSSSISESCTLDKPGIYTMSPSTYYLNGSLTTGGITINSNNITLDCNGSIIIGNFTGAVDQRRGIYDSKMNTIIKNCRLNNYFYPLRSLGAVNSTYLNNTIFNCSRGISLYSTNNSFIYNNTITYFTSYGMTIEGSDFNIISGNLINQTYNTGDQKGFYISRSVEPVYSDFNNFSFNYIYGNNLLNGGFISINHLNNGSNFINNYIIGTKQAAINIYNSSDILIFNNTIINISAQQGIQSYNIYGNINISNNYIYNVSSSGSSGIYLFGLNLGNTSYISNNIIYKCAYGIRTLGYSNNTIKNNLIDGISAIGAALRGISIEHGSNYTYVSNNLINNVDVGIIFWNVTGAYLKDNIVYNATYDYDAYNTAYRFRQVDMGYSINNTANNTLKGFLIRKSNNIQLINNTIISILPNKSYSAWSRYDVQPCVDISELVETWIGGNEEINRYDNVTYIGTFKSNNITITNTNCLNFGVYLRLQGSQNIKHDFTNYWYRSFNFPNYLLDTDELFINNDWDSVYYINASRSYDKVGKQGYYGVFFSLITITKDYMYFKNLNNSNYSGLNLFNANKGLIYFNNNSGFIFNGNKSIFLDYLNSSYFLDNFNLTEGQNRQYSPIWFSSSTSNEKHIASNLTDSVNVTVILDLGNCDTKNYLKYVSDKGTTYTWSGRDAQAICKIFVTTGLELPIDTASASNIISWVDVPYSVMGSCTTSGTILITVIGYLGIVFLVMIFGIIMVIILLSLNGYLDLGNVANNVEFNWKTILLSMFIALLVIAIIAGMTGLFNNYLCEI